MGTICHGYHLSWLPFIMATFHGCHPAWLPSTMAIAHSVVFRGERGLQIALVSTLPYTLICFFQVKSGSSLFFGEEARLPSVMATFHHGYPSFMASGQLNASLKWKGASNTVNFHIPRTLNSYLSDQTWTHSFLESMSWLPSVMATIHHGYLPCFMATAKPLKVQCIKTML